MTAETKISSLLPMYSPIAISDEETIVAILASVIGVIFLAAAPRSCNPSAASQIFASPKVASQSFQPSPGSPKLVNAPILAPIQASAHSPENAQPTATQDSSLAATPLAQSPSKKPSKKPSQAPSPSSSLPATSPELEDVKKNTLKIVQISAINSARSSSSPLNTEETTLHENDKSLGQTTNSPGKQYQEKFLALEAKNKGLNQKLAEQSEATSPTASSEDVLQETALPRNPVFARSHKDLDKNKQALATIIRQFDNLSSDVLATRYQELTSQLGSKNAGRIRFARGKTHTTPGEIAHIEGLAQVSQASSEFLVVGFTDPSGNAKANQQLASKRARIVASELSKKVGNARVQATYIGQTTRFGTSEENKVVEIWEILPANSETK